MITKAKQVIGKTLTFRDALREDAQFIFGLRNDPIKSRYLSATSPQLQDQYAWLEAYEKKTDQAYFIIEYDNNPIGTVRLYDQQGNSFCWGSWILIDSRPTHAAMESALMVYSYAITDLGFSAAHFDVRKENDKVWKFHERFGAVKIREENDDYFFSLSLDAIKASLSKYAKFLPDPVTVMR
jgi:RimJ/RimL family protein N-acetyltransferase